MIFTLMSNFHDIFFNTTMYSISVGLFSAFCVYILFTKDMLVFRIFIYNNLFYTVLFEDFAKGTCLAFETSVSMGSSPIGSWNVRVQKIGFITASIFIFNKIVSDIKVYLWIITQIIVAIF